MLKRTDDYDSVFQQHESNREAQFAEVWTEQLNDAFSDIARYYDRANNVASLGQWNRFLNAFMSIIELRPGQEVLDLCAGTNAVGLELLRRQPDLTVTAMDRSRAMQEVGRQSALKQGTPIESVIGDAHHLPFPDNNFDIVTLQWASRHLRIEDVLREVQRVLRPGGSFYHCDMLRPANPLVARAYYTFLRGSLEVTSRLFASGAEATRQKAYFIETLSQFYSAAELSEMLRGLGYVHVADKTVLMGMIGFHRASKP